MCATTPQVPKKLEEQPLMGVAHGGSLSDHTQTHRKDDQLRLFATLLCGRASWVMGRYISTCGVSHDEDQPTISWLTVFPC